MKMEFSDGMKFDTSGEYRIERRSDGLYVVGRGMLCPVDDRAEGERMIAELTQPPCSICGAKPAEHDEAKCREEYES